MHKYATIVQILHHLLTLHKTKHFTATCALWGLVPQPMIGAGKSDPIWHIRIFGYF